MVALAVSQSIATLEWLNSGHFSPAQLFATSEPGVWYDPSDVANTLWRYNLFTFTEQFDNAAWQKGNCTVTANSTIAPDGTLTGDTLVEDTANVNHVVSQTPTFAANSTNTVSCFIKAAGRTQARIFWSTAYNATARSAIFELSGSGSIVQSDVGVTASIQSVGNDWYRCVVTSTSNTGNTSANIFIAPAVSGSSTYTGNGTSGIFLWGAQLEAGSTATTYQPITTVDAGTIARFPQATLYQDSAGTIPVTAPAQPVGLMLDKKQGLVLGSELVVNGDFASDTWWSKDATATISSGVGVFTNTSASSGFFRSNLLEVGKSYRVTYTIVSLSSGAIRVLLGSGSSIVRSAAGTYSEVIQCAGTTQLYIQAFSGSATNATIDNISVRELPGTHSTQSTSASRPTYGIVPATGRRNLLTWTEQFDNAAWGKTNATITANTTTAPNGTNTADKLVENTAVSVQHFFSQTPATTLNTAYALSVYAKASERSRIQIFAFGSATTLSTFDLSNGTVVGGPGVIQSVGDGWYRCTMPFLGATTSTLLGVFLVSSGTTTTYTGDGTSGVFFWGAQLETGSTATAYQRVVTAFEVTEANVASLSYLSFDGIDDFMVTPTITPGTDKVQVFAGVRKLSDAASNIIMEFSPDSSASNGSFHAETRSTGGYRFRSRGTIQQDATIASGFASPLSNIYTGIGDISGDNATLRLNGVQVVQSTADQGTGNYLAYPMFIGRRGGTSLPFNGQMYGLITRFGANLNTSQIVSTEGWMNTKTRAY